MTVLLQQKNFNSKGLARREDMLSYTETREIIRTKQE